jgi:crossover junction endodeoxyribonuclease RuvC
MPNGFPRQFDPAWHAFPVRILAIDPSLRGTGYAILEGTAEKPAVLASGTIKNPASRTSQDCLIEIHDRLSELISQHSPTALAIELIIYVQNTRTAVILGAARGVALLAAARGGLTIHEYPPKLVKKSATGKGAAKKEQVAFMTRALFGLRHNPLPDEADALAVGLTHLRRVAFSSRMVPAVS